MCGKTFLTELKKDFLLKDIPVFVFSTSSDPQDREDSLRLGAISFFTKPRCFEELRKKILSAFSLVPLKLPFGQTAICRTLCFLASGFFPSPTFRLETPSSFRDWNKS